MTMDDFKWVFETQDGLIDVETDGKAKANRTGHQQNVHNKAYQEACQV